MNKTVMMISLTALSLGAACSNSTGNSAGRSSNSTQTSSSRSQNANLPTQDGDNPGRGKVTKINSVMGSVERDHEEIKGVMARMVMEFFVTDKTMLNRLEVGDVVDFASPCRSF